MATATREVPTLQAENRQKLGSRDAARIRETGRIPAVIYGHGEDPEHIVIDRKSLYKLWDAGWQTLQLDRGGKTEYCLIKQLQWDHLGIYIQHVDLTRVRLDEKVQVTVPLEFVGEAPGLKDEGAVMQHPYAELLVECTAVNVPEHIVVDVGSMGAGDTLTAGEITLPEGATLVSEPDTAVATITVVQEQPEEQPEGGEGEPEVINRGGEEGGESGGKEG